jgi:hypothetical protein
MVRERPRIGPGSVRPGRGGFGFGVNWGRIVTHEPATPIGVGHIESRTSIMNETFTRQTILGAPRRAATRP